MPSLTLPTSKVASLSRRPPSAHTYTLFDLRNGGISPHWQSHGEPRAVHAVRTPDGGCFPPLWPDYVVRAQSAAQACALAHSSQTSLDDPSGRSLGVWWTKDHDLHLSPPPLSKSTAARWCSVADCGTRAIYACPTEDDAARIHDEPCGPGCGSNHHLLLLTDAERKRLRAEIEEDCTYEEWRSLLRFMV